MEDIDYGFKTAIRHRIVLEQKELCHAQRSFTINSGKKSGYKSY